MRRLASIAENNPLNGQLRRDLLVSYPSFLEVLSFIRVTVRAPSAFFAASVQIHPKILTNKETERVPLSESASFAHVDATLLGNQTALRLIGRISDIFGPERTLCHVQWVPVSDSTEFKTLLSPPVTLTQPSAMRDVGKCLLLSQSIF
jgi:hypothetical protein